MRVKEAFDYDDVLIIPRLSGISSRDAVKMNSNFLGCYPIFSSPMKGISGPKLVIEMGKLGCIGILNRFGTYLDKMDEVKQIYKSKVNFGISVGYDNLDQNRDFIKFAVDYGANLICLDVANGYLLKLAKVLNYISMFNVPVMAGNVVTAEGADFLYENGATFIRTGIGGGTLCLTRNVTGIGVPQLTAIDNVDRSKYRDKFYIVSDGGIRNSGDAVKSFACGADFVMIGSLLARSLEAENDGIIRGMASREIQQEYNTSVKSVEGLEKEVSGNKVPLKEIITEFLYGVKSACTYLGCESYKEISLFAEFVSTGKGTLKDVT